MLVMVVFFIAFRWIHLSTPLIRLFLLVLILLLMPTLNFLPVWLALSLLRFRLPSLLPMMILLRMVATLFPYTTLFRSATIFRLSFAVTVALAVLVLGEPLTAPKLAGLALVLAAVWLLLAAPGAASSDVHRERRSSLARVLVATVAVGIASFTYKLGLREGATPISLVAAQGAVAVTLSTAFTAYVDRRI